MRDISCPGRCPARFRLTPVKSPVAIFRPPRPRALKPPLSGHLGAIPHRSRRVAGPNGLKPVIPIVWQALLTGSTKLGVSRGPEYRGRQSRRLLSLWGPAFTGQRDHGPRCCATRGCGQHSHKTAQRAPTRTNKDLKNKFCNLVLNGIQEQQFHKRYCDEWGSLGSAAGAALNPRSLRQEILSLPPCVAHIQNMCGTTRPSSLFSTRS